MKRTLLTNGVICLACRWSPSCRSLQVALEGFLHPWFTPAEGVQQPDLTITLLPTSDFPAQARAACVKPMVIRRSTAPIFNLEVLCGRGPEGDLAAWDASRQVGYLVDQTAAEVRFFGSVDTGFIHLIELVRYYGLLIEQARGTLILHASAVCKPEAGTVVGIVGAKGAGKTTTMLSMVATGQYAYFSGDKLLLRLKDGVPHVRGWPDYPHIGIGTLTAHPALASQIGIALHADDGSPLAPTHKVLIPPQQFLQAIGAPRVATGRQSMLMLPDVNERTRAGEITLKDAEKESVGTDELLEWPHRFVTACWHGLPLARCAPYNEAPGDVWAALKTIPWIRHFGAHPGARTTEHT